MEMAVILTEAAASGLCILPRVILRIAPLIAQQPLPNPDAKHQHRQPTNPPLQPIRARTRNRQGPVNRVQEELELEDTWRTAMGPAILQIAKEVSEEHLLPGCVVAWGVYTDVDHQRVRI